MKKIVVLLGLVAAFIGVRKLLAASNADPLPPYSASDYAPSQN